MWLKRVNSATNNTFNYDCHTECKDCDSPAKHCGCGIIVNNEDHSKSSWDFDYDYKNLEKNRIELLNLISVDEFKEIFS